VTVPLLKRRSMSASNGWPAGAAVLPHS